MPILGIIASQISGHLAFPAGNQSASNLLSLMSTIVQYQTTAPSAGGTLTLNSVSLGSYDYTIKNGNQTISSFTNTDWFTTTADTRSGLIAVNGNLTINSGQTFIPTNRKLFTCIYVKGNLTINGSISMSARGSNHSGDAGSGGAVTAGAILLASGTYGGVVNPQVPSTGGSGGAGGNVGNNVSGPGSAGSAGTSGGTGGGGGGSMYKNPGSYTGQAGSAGTSFTGGTGGGAYYAITTGGSSPTAGTANGGRGGDSTGNVARASGGSGNPAGTNTGGGSGYDGATGTGGVLIIYCTGTLSGSGTVTANGATFDPSSLVEVAGGSTGGGSVTILYNTDSSSITPTAAGGYDIGQPTAGTGGAGTARKLSGL